MKYIPVMSYSKFCLLGAALAALTGCNSPEPKLPHVNIETTSHMVMFEGSKAQLSLPELEAFNGFIDSLPVSAVTDVELQASDSSPRAVERAKRIKAYMGKRGVSQKVIHLQPIVTRDANTVGVNVQYAKGIPPKGCPDWSKNATANYSNTGASGFGCAYYNNLIVQMANPADYEAGEGKPVYDAARDSVALGKYLAGTAASTGSSSSGSSGSSSSSGASSSSGTSAQ